MNEPIGFLNPTFQAFDRDRSLQRSSREAWDWTSSREVHVSFHPAERKAIAGAQKIVAIWKLPPDDGVERQIAMNMWQFRVKSGVDRVRFGDPRSVLPRARDGESVRWLNQVP
jgi:hypothetical protein